MLSKTMFVVQPSRVPKLMNIITIQAMLAPVIRKKKTIRIICEQLASYSFSLFLTSLSLTRMQQIKM